MGVDVGGTFTDVVLLQEDGTATPKKVLSSPPHFNVAIKTGIQTEWDLKQLGISTAAGFGFGTVFGAGFTGAGFKLATRKMRSTAVKQLNDLHQYGRSEITGQRLFKDLGTVKEKSQYYKNLTKEEINQIEYKSKLHGKSIKDQVDNLDDIDIDATSKPPKELLNYTKYSPKRNAILLKYLFLFIQEFLLSANKSR